MPTGPTMDAYELPSYIALCQEWMRRDTLSGDVVQQFHVEENAGVCMDWTAPHYNLLEMISSSLLQEGMPGIKYSHDCKRTRTWDEAVLGFDRTCTTVQPFFLEAPMSVDPTSTEIRLKIQCPKSNILVSKLMLRNHPFAFPTNFDVPFTCRRRLAENADNCPTIISHQQEMRRKMIEQRDDGQTKRKLFNYGTVVNDTALGQ